MATTVLVAALRKALAPTFAIARAIPRCSVCRKLATCVGKYGDDKSESFACDDCCGHWCIGGQCAEVPDNSRAAKGGA
jgi:hypothetical protein